jgi:hypothetical protein
MLRPQEASAAAALMEESRRARAAEADATKVTECMSAELAEFKSESERRELKAEGAAAALRGAAEGAEAAARAACADAESNLALLKKTVQRCQVAHQGRKKAEVRTNK